MTPSFKSALRIMLVLLLSVCLYLFLLLQPRIVRYSAELTIIDTRAGEIDINYPPGFRTAIWYQDIERFINVRVIVLP